MPRIRHVFFGQQVGDVTGGPVTCGSYGRKYCVMTIVHEHHPAAVEEAGSLMRSPKAVLSRVNEIAVRAEAIAGAPSPQTLVPILQQGARTRGSASVQSREEMTSSGSVHEREPRRSGWSG